MVEVYQEEIYGYARRSSNKVLIDQKLDRQQKQKVRQWLFPEKAKGYIGKTMYRILEGLTVNTIYIVTLLNIGLLYKKSNETISV